MFIDGEPDIFAGLDIVKRSVYGFALGEVWIYIRPSLDSLSKEIRAELGWHIAWKLKHLTRREWYYRIQAECRSTDMATQKLLESLGFQKEGVMANASEFETDLILYARTPGSDIKHSVPGQSKKVA